ncbi:MAG: sugar phosphate isomerase/epimerase [Clostridiales bacterium]|nr:sugar phosphate isomerase/epimerase [Clostridiales bacterium]HOA84698.1 sugar phosphate isomerase/epimerase [Bacillota bacterium]
MKLSVLTNLYGSKSLEQTLRILTGLGIRTVEIGCGGYPGKAHCNPAELLADEAAYQKFVDTFRKYDVEICALACHGNPVHPDAAIAKSFDEDFRNAVLLAEKLGINTIIGFSGCPGDHEGAKFPNWVTCPWPGDYLKILEWQWNEVLIPYWKKTAAFAAEHGVTRIAFEMHPGFCVYNPETLLRLREAVGDTIGANLDPSHLIWQGMDPVAVIRELKGIIYHVHAKDTKVDKYNTARNGVLDTKHYTDELGRAWIFRTVGYGNGESFWRDFVSNLRLCGYDGVLSIEHEDSVMTKDEGLRKAVEFLRSIIIFEEKPKTITWA